MSNKADIIAKIKSCLTLNPLKTVRAKHEEYVYNDDNSLLESIYADVITETSLSPSIFTPLTDISYSIKIMKVGRQITLSGVITNNRTSGVSSLLDISDSDYICDENTEYIGIGTMISGEFVKLRVRNLTGAFDFDQVQFLGILLPSESFNFTLTYNARN